MKARCDLGWVLGGAIAVACGVMGCDLLLTEAPPAGDDFVSPLPGLSPSLNRAFLDGDGAFEQAFTAQTGLGPLFNHVSCEGCHPGDGRGTEAEAFFRFSQGGDLLREIGGPQLQDRALPGVAPEVLPEGVDTSRRLPPPVFGMGLIEAIPATTILALADPDDEDEDGISGRPNFVAPAAFVPADQVGAGPGLQLGRFSRKANVSSLVQQVAEAYHQDMGITSDLIPLENPHPQAGGPVFDAAPDPEISASTVMSATLYVRLLAPPRQQPPTGAALEGARIFAQAGCAACHVPTLKTGPHAIPQLSEVDVNLYSDLLLHDMGPALADGRPDGQATGSEWRTAPLWGLRVASDFTGGQTFYLHDGRTTSLHEAIILHGGEAEASVRAYESSGEEGQAALRAFLLTL